MFLLALLVLCVATVPLLGGRLGNLANITFQRAWVGVGALLLQFSIMRLFPEGDTALHRGLHLATYAMMFWFLMANLALPGLWLMGLGGALNALAIVANQGVMPAHPQALSTAGIVQVPGEFANSAAVSNPHLWFLGDIFALPAGWPMANVFSIGDVVLILGAFVLLHRMGASRIAPRLARLSRWTYRFTGPQATLLREERPFRRLWVAQAVSGIGDWIFPPAVFTALIATNGARPSDLALLLIAQVAPGMLVGLFGGPFIDRFSRKWLMVATDVVRGLAVGSMLLVDAPTLLHVYAVSLVIGIGGAVFQPSFMAVLPNIVPRGRLVPANALVGLSQSVAIMAGFPLGGLIVEQWGVSWGFAVNAVSFGFCAVLVAGTVVPRRAKAEKRGTLWKELLEGLRYVKRSREVLAIIVIVCLIAVAAGIKSPLEPLFAMVSLGSGTAGFALLGAVWGGGMIAGSFFASAADNHFGHRELISVSVVVVGLCVGIAAFSPGIGPVFMLWLIAGVANTLGTVAYETMIQESTPDEVRGRVMAALEAGLQAGLLVGVVLAGLSDRVTNADPGRTGMAAAGVFFLMAGLAAWWMLQRRPAAAAAAAAAFDVRSFEVVPTGGFGLVRVTLAAADGPPPVLVADDGSQVHRLEPLPGGAATPDGALRLGYGVPQALLERAALSLEVRGRGLIDLSM